MPLRSRPSAPSPAGRAPLPPRRPRTAQRATVAALGLAIVAAVVVSGSVGTVDVGLLDTARIVLGHLLPGMPWMSDGSLTPLQDQAVWQFRLPRALLAGLAGAGLALAGAIMQVIVRNPLAEPYLLGVSSGAGVGAVLVITLGSTAVGGLPLGAAAFAGALVASACVVLTARRRGVLSPTRMVLSGVALGSLFSAVTSYLTLTTDAQNVFSVLFFLLGSVSGASMGSLVVPAVALAAACLVVGLRTRAMNALLSGDESATALGIDVNRLRAILLVTAALLTGSIVSVSGGIGFVGLVIPHVARILLGADHRRMLPVTVLGGALFLMFADLLSRTVAAPAEVPIGILTAAVGAPFFLWLMHRDAAAQGGLDR